MIQDFLSLAKPSIRDLKPYQPGKPIEELECELGISDIIKLASNENPLGAGEAAKAAALKGLSNLELYPDASTYRLKQALAERLGVNADQFTMGAGSDNVLALIVQAFTMPGDEVVISEYAFATFSIITRGMGAIPMTTPSNNWSHDLSAMAKAITDKTKIIFIANPNNPTGTWVTEKEFTAFLQQVPKNVIVVMDEAYYEYATDSEHPNCIALQKTYSNLIITRTFSKIHGIAALRVGYGVSTPEIADILNRIRLPFNVTSPGIEAAYAALHDEAHVEATLSMNDAGYVQLSTAFDEMGFEYIPSATNFLTIDVKRDAGPIYGALLQKGIIVRPLQPYNMPNHLRVTIGLEEQNARFLSALQEIV